MKKFYFIIFICVFLFPFSVFSLDYPEINSKAVVIYDRNDNKILYEKNSNEVRSIASLTKIATTIVAIENINDLDEKVLITKDILDTVDWDASRAGLNVNDNVTYRDLLYASILPSGADATNALAISLFGSIDEFVLKMNELVNKLHLKNTHFVNVTGLDVDGHYGTAEDVSILLNYALDNSLFKTIYTTKHYTLSNGLEVNSTLFKYNGDDVKSIIGSKTGYTGEAMYCISTLSETDGHEIIIVLLGAEHKDNYYYNVVDSRNLISFVNANYSNKVLISNNSFVKRIPVSVSKIDYYDIKSDKELNMFLENDYNKDDFKVVYNGIEELSYKNKLGDVIGTLNYYFDNELIYSSPVILDINIDISIIKFIKKNIIFISLGTLFIISFFVSVIVFISKKKNASL